jgi:serine/threonine-protein kinase HipA
MSRTVSVEVVASWAELPAPARMGQLTATSIRAKEVFAFAYDEAWLASGAASAIDPDLALFRGPQYPPKERESFGVFLDSAPDRWGRLLMQRREALRAREEERPARRLLESDYLLGVHDGHRIGALRFKLGDRFVDDDDKLAAPPLTSLRELEHASLSLEREDAERHRDYAKWVRMLVAPGGSLGGARPKASVRDADGHLWIAKFPSRLDTGDVGAWEFVVHALAREAGVEVPEARAVAFRAPRRARDGQRTFLSRRFDRTAAGARLHFASAMTLLGRTDGDGASTGVGYLDLADLLVRMGAEPSRDLEQLWRRVVFSMCVSNTDDHLRNHGFLLTPRGWRLAPAYDQNPNPEGDALALNVSEIENAIDLDLALSVAPAFRVSARRARAVLAEVVHAASAWAKVAAQHGIARAEIEALRDAFRLAAPRTSGSRGP